MQAGPERLSSALSDRYLIERELGAGGMATVYLAQDLKHDRKVAIKVLRPELAAVIGADRFLSEIKTTANLQHPQILPLHDSGEADGFLFYVMPYVEGESLRDRLMREKQLPIPDAVRIATEVAGALDYAHRHNVIHRDIKPENILLHDGHALVADFGIALAASKAGNTRMTETGMSLGTPHYMSPEQAMGEREITARSDVYALGCVLYEMLTGDPPFTGSTAQAIVARVLTEAPRSMAIQRHTIPESIEAAVLTALEKLPADRFASAAEFAAALTDGTYAARHDGKTVARKATTSPSRRLAALLPWGVAVVLLATLAWSLWFRSTSPPPAIRYSMGVPPDQAMRQGVLGVNIAFSPDGRRIVYVGGGERETRLWVRERDRLDATPLPGTDGASNPFFSPDGTRIAFNTGTAVELRVVPVTGGPPITLATPGPGSGGGGAWGPDGWIYFDSPAGINRIRSDGGTPELFIPYDTVGTDEIGHAWPEALPNGKGLVYRSRRGVDQNEFDLVAIDLVTRERHLLTKGLMARYVAPGFLVFLRADGAVLAAPFDQDKLALTGPAVPLFEGVMTKPFGSGDLAISRTGTLAYVPGRSSAAGGFAELVFVGRDGAATPLAPPVTYNPSTSIYSLSLSPDGSKIALDVGSGNSVDIWIKQLPAGPLQRLTFTGRFAVRPQWTPDGRSLLYIVVDSSSPVPTVWRRRADGSAPAERVWGVPGRAVIEASLSRDGRWLLYVVADSARSAIYGVRLGQDTVPVPLITDPYVQRGAALSPDGRWLAYSSNESGREEVYVRPFPRTNDGKWQISTTGGTAARWARSGHELFFENPAGEMMAVAVTSGRTFAPAEPRRLFPTFFSSSGVPYYDLTPDDRRFVMARLASINQAPGAGQLVVVDHWTTELFARMRSR